MSDNAGQQMVEQSSSRTIRTIIVDDEPLARAKLRFMLERESGVQIVAECVDAEEAVTAIEKYRPELLLLDIKLTAGSGFDVLRQITTRDFPITIFTTAYDTYALEAFDAKALDYLLKPFDQLRLHRALTRAKCQLLKLERSPANEKNLEGLFHTADKLPGRLIIKSQGRYVFLQMQEIEFIEAAGNYVRLHLAGGRTYLHRETIQRMEERLNALQFTRVHRSYIVNTRKVKEMEPCRNGEFILSLSGGKNIPCSRNYHFAIKALCSRL